MIKSAALTLCLPLLALTACNRDEPATYLPKSGQWTYEEQTVSSNTCDENSLPDPLSTFTLDYDDGDSFQVELGEDDVTCEIDGTEFYCTDLVVDFPVEGFDAVLRLTMTWEGEFSSSTSAAGNEITRRVCIGEACPLVEMVVMVPCTRIVAFEARAL
jgi:hypothetical protein